MLFFFFLFALPFRYCTADLASVDSTTCQKAFLTCLFACRSCHSSNRTCVLGGTRTNGVADKIIQALERVQLSNRTDTIFRCVSNTIGISSRHTTQTHSEFGPNCKRNRNNNSKKKPRKTGRSESGCHAPSSIHHTQNANIYIYKQTYSALHSVGHQHTFPYRRIDSTNATRQSIHLFMRPARSVLYSSNTIPSRKL